MTLILAGKSAAGKDTLCKKLISDYGFIPIISDTTRPMREGEVDGVDYNFITVEEYNKRNYIETRLYESSDGTWFYGCPDSDSYADPSKNYIIILDPYGAQEFKEWVGESNVAVCYVDCPDDVREKRAKSRGSFNAEEWSNRLKDDNERFCADIMDGLVTFMVSSVGSVDRVSNSIASRYKKFRSSISNSSLIE